MILSFCFLSQFSHIQLTTILTFCSWINLHNSLEAFLYLVSCMVHHPLSKSFYILADILSYISFIVLTALGRSFVLFCVLKSSIAVFIVSLPSVCSSFVYAVGRFALGSSGHPGMGSNCDLVGFWDSVSWDQFSRDQLPPDQLSRDQLATRSTLMRSTCWSVFELGITAYHKSQLLSQCVLLTNF